MYGLAKMGVKAYQGKAGGKFSGARKSNLNQYYRHVEYDEDVHSMQVEIIRSLRTDIAMASLTVDHLSKAIEMYAKHVTNDVKYPPGWHSFVPNLSY
jgi:hypothetical protein